MRNTNNLSAVDLFAGAGGLSLAAINSGFNIKFAIENDSHSATTYRQNICKLPGNKRTVLYEEDILEYSPEQLKKTHFNNRACDLLLGGPPCQGFSTHRILDAGVNDPRNELILSYFSFVKSLSPSVFLLENVPGILWERHKKHLKRFYSAGRAAGYYLMDPALIDARDYGVPQRRRRVFIIGFREDTNFREINWPPPPTHSDPRIEDSRLKPWVSCKHVFKRSLSGDINNLHMNHGPELIATFKKTPLNGGSRQESGRILKCHKNHNGHKDVYGRIDPNQPAPTMTTACINPSKGRFVHPTDHNGITARHAARIQTFPDDFTFHGGLTAAGRQIGNAVPVELGKALIKPLHKFIITNKSRTSKQLGSRRKANPKNSENA